MAKHKHREQDQTSNDTSSNINDNARNTPFGIDPMQLMGLLGGNFDMNNMGNMLASMNTNGFNLGNLNSIAQMMGLNLDNNLFQGNMSGSQSNVNNKNMYSNPKEYSSNTNPKNSENLNEDKGVKKNNVTTNRNIKDKDANLEFLMAIRSYAHPDRIKFIDRIIEAYKNGELKEA
ncbi:hypothetical protein CBE01nite_01650 [Clostridium beijerinckii]|uniref:Uncharacterized protein n=2 Tax=Clostridium beijerinckii TaxID=1520 RepID=A0AB74VJX0_CLOBE|nr:hypothetical protein [Clostridium beijerinckii]NRZ25894.1 hypothetical protein [Clostridium beijerinckii]NSB16213.1 hypothetical protein [Clostridium beijerinckii]NYB98409.1 hypothetical protein [Clostridium beijerinckii]OOM27003.1 hypothetical protein CLBEI_07460 [Clostridium beijerinckii]OOM34247.1 hypothetical protein CLOBE_01880 [Clostridium beijerinckii]